VLKTGIALLLAVLLAGHAPSGLADNHKKIWACAARGADEEDLWLVSWGSQSYIKLYGNRVWSNHYAEDENLRWDFGRGAGGLAQYSAILHPDGDLDYYDFRNMGQEQPEPLNYRYRCRLAQS
jgi:hypothetical protein